jgi:hypothetical protein
MNWPSPIEKIILYSGADFDALFASWLFVRNVPFAKYAKFDFVKIGETWKNEPADSDPAIVHIDTGGGRFDHHGGKNKSATRIMVAELGLVNDEALKKLLALIEAYENADKMEFYAPSQLITGWYYLYRTNPKLVLERAFELFDILHGQEKQRVEIEAKSDQVRWEERNGTKIAVLDEIAQLRDWCFDNGAEIVAWKNTNNGIPYYGIQVSRNSNNSLERIVAALRKLESSMRKVDLGEANLETIEELEKLPGWYLHHSKKLILCGSRKKPLKKHEVSLLSFDQIVETISENI